MTVDIFSIAPPSVHAETVTFGGAEIEIRPLHMAQIAKIAQRYDAFRKVYFSPKEVEIEREFRAAAMIEAYPAIVCAGTGKDGGPDARIVEAHIARFDDDDIADVARAIMRLTNGPAPEETEDKGSDPLLASGAAASANTGEGPDASESTPSLAQSSS